MDEKTTITDQIKDLFTTIKERYVNPISIVIILYIVIHFWKIFYLIFTEEKMSYQKRFFEVDKLWDQMYCGITPIILQSLVILIIGAVTVTAAKSIIDIWNKYVRNKLINIIDKYEVETKDNLQAYKNALESLQNKNQTLNSEKAASNLKIESLESTIEINHQLNSQINKFKEYGLVTRIVYEAIKEPGDGVLNQTIENIQNIIRHYNNRLLVRIKKDKSAWSFLNKYHNIDPNSQNEVLSLPESLIDDFSLALNVLKSSK